MLTRTRTSAFGRCVLFLVGLLGIAQVQIVACAQSAAAPRAAASALLAVDQNRSTVIERIVLQWGVPLAQSSAAISIDQLRSVLEELRADHLLAASLAGTLDGLRNALSLALASSAPVRASLVNTKALGDSTDDLVYTPINPCRIVDTRLGAGGFLNANTARDWNASRPAGNFTDQGGSNTNCAIPAGPAAVLANLAVTGSSQPGVVFASAFNTPDPVASVLNYAGGETIANAVIVPTAIGQAKELHIFASSGTHVIVDVLGYFSAPSGAGPFFLNGGNAFGTIATLGTLDNRELDIKVNNQRAMRYEPALPTPNLIGGYVSNSVTGGVYAAAIGGGGAPGTAIPFSPNPLGCPYAFGCQNSVTDHFGTIGGGAGNLVGNSDINTANSMFGAVAGGLGNGAAGVVAFVGGGLYNQALVEGSTVGGGESNTASGGISTIGGGSSNVASGDQSTIGGGALNNATATSSTVGGGSQNSASGGSSTVGGGSSNTAAGLVATVPGGFDNHANAPNSFAAGRGATIPATAGGSFLWSDSVFPGATLPAGAHDQFIVASTNGIGMYTSKTFATGCSLTGAATMWVCTSDRDVKENFVELNTSDVLRRVSAMPITRWNEKGAPGIEHVGPVAQDFYAAFGLGADDRHIGSGDLSGVALVAIQGLHQLVQQKDARIAALERAVAELQRALEALALRH